MPSHQVHFGKGILGTFLTILAKIIMPFVLFALLKFGSLELSALLILIVGVRGSNKVLSV